MPNPSHPHPHAHETSTDPEMVPLSAEEDAVLQEDLDLALTSPHPSGKAHPHVHNPASQRKILNRLARIQGHVNGIRTMIEQDQPCPDVLLQIAAVRGALDRVARLILDEHISECIIHAAETGSIEVELEELKRALDRYIH